MLKIAKAVEQMNWLDRLARKITGRRLATHPNKAGQVSRTCDGALPDTFLLRVLAERSLLPVR